MISLPIATKRAFKSFKDKTTSSALKSSSTPTIMELPLLSCTFIFSLPSSTFSGLIKAIKFLLTIAPPKFINEMRLFKDLTKLFVSNSFTPLRLIT